MAMILTVISLLNGVCDDAINAESYWAGVKYAEKAHGIGVDDE